MVLSKKGLGQYKQYLAHALYTEHWRFNLLTAAISISLIEEHYCTLQLKVLDWFKLPLLIKFYREREGVLGDCGSFELQIMGPFR